MDEMDYYKSISEMRRYEMNLLEQTKTINEKIIVKVVADRWGFTLATKKYLVELEDLKEITRDHEGNISLNMALQPRR